MALLTTIQAMKAAAPVGRDLPSYNFYEGASVASLVGAPMVITSGYVVEAAYNEDGALVGVAEQAGANTTASTTPNFRVILALPHTIFEANMATTTSSDPDQATSNQIANLGVKYGIAKGTTSGLWYIDVSNTTNLRVVVIGLKDPIGTVGGRVYFMWLLNGNGTGHSTLFS